MSLKAIRNVALAATFLAGSAAIAEAQTSSTLGTGGTSTGGGFVNSVLGTGGSSAGAGGGSASTLGLGGATAGRGTTSVALGTGGSAAGVGGALADHISSLTRSLGLPQRLSEVGVPEAGIPALVEGAMGDGCTLLNPREPSDEDFEELFRAAL